VHDGHWRHVERHELRAALVVTLLFAVGCGGGGSAGPYALQIFPTGDGSGTITSAPSGIDCGAACEARFAAGTAVALTATAAAGSRFDGWSGDCDGASATTSVTMSGTRACAATFTAMSSVPQYALTVAKAGAGVGSVTSSPAGIDCGASCSASFSAGSNVTLTATPDASSVFVSWTGDCIGNGSTVSVPMIRARSCTATFAVKTFPLTITKAGTGSGRVTSMPMGVDCGATCAPTFAINTALTLLAMPAPGSIFMGWSGDCAGTRQTTMVTMSDTRSCTATFAPGVSRVPFPQMPGHGQPPLSKLQLVTITFDGYPHKDWVEAFGDYVVHSQWLDAVTQDFGPIPATHLAKVVLPSAGVTANSDFGSIVQANIGGALPWPTDTEGLLYLVYSPSPCVGHGGGYHYYVYHNNVRAAYAVAFNCDDKKAAEGVASHEIAEAITDPYMFGLFFEGSTYPWNAENGDICSGAPWWMEGGFRFLPAWSNRAAASGGNPCVPNVVGNPYYNVSPSPSTPQYVAAGGSVTFTLTGWSTVPVNPWSLTITPDSYSAQDFATTPQFTSTTIGNGTTVQLTLHVPPGTPAGKSAILRIGSVLPDVVDGVGNFAADWPVMVIAQ